ncbi:MAG: HDOD domain-containing protein [Verrucomicrobiales bacterium]|nr:HDOD domain-containing protein [Verrucomicrobiales bacterium]
MRHLDDYLDKVSNLPPAPRVLTELLTLLGRDDVDSEKIVSIIALDPGLTASVLQLANSALLAAARPAEELSEAVARLGFNQVFQLVAALVGGSGMAPPQPGYGIDSGELWRHSVTVAVAAQLVAEEVGDAPAIVYTAALLHDIGKIVLSETLVQSYAALVADTEQQQLPLIEAERRVLGTDHAEIGGRLLTRWKMPAGVVAAVTYHHAPQEAGTHARLAAHVYVGNMLAHMMGYGCGHVPFAIHGRSEAMRILGLGEESLPKFMIATFEKLGFVEALFGAVSKSKAAKR